MEAMLWTNLALLAFAYAGYPASLWVMARLRPMPVRRILQTPSIDVVLVVHDGAGLLSAKLDNLLALDYPPDRLRINIVADGCTDATVAIASLRLGPRVRVFDFPQRRGKSASIGSVLSLLDREVLIFTDARQRIEPGSARALVAALGDPSVGAASGELVLQADSGFGRGVDAYWRYEKSIRRLESASGSMVSVTGALYAVRRDNLKHVPSGMVLDDMWIPLSIAATGLRIVFVPEAVAHDLASTQPAQEEQRKRRTLAGNFQLLHLWPELAVPGMHPLSLRLWGHKWLRLLAPWLLSFALLSNAVLAMSSTGYLALFLLQLACYGLALMGRLIPALLSLSPVRLCTAFASLNLSAALALFDYLTNADGHLWQPSPAEGS